jgi:hypothetical protein
MSTDQTVDTEISTESTDQPYTSVQQNVLLDYPDPLKDHLYCKQLPWPGKKQTKTKLTKANISRESADFGPLFLFFQRSDLCWLAG